MKHFLFFFIFLIAITGCKTRKNIDDRLEENTLSTDTSAANKKKVELQNEYTEKDTTQTLYVEIDSLIEKSIVIDSISTHNQTDVSQIIPDTISVIGVGDIMLGTSFPDKSTLPPNNDCTSLLADVKPILQRADITFGNLEGAFSDNAPVVKTCQDSTKCYAFRTPESYFQCLVDAGFDLFSMANNHIFDLGVQGKNTTVELIEQASLAYAGPLDKPYAIVEKNGVKYGFCAFAPNSGVCHLLDVEGAMQIVTMLDSLTDIVIVSFHGGAEGRDHQHVTKKTEKFYGEDRGNVYEFAHKMVDAGADIIFGHGPHVVRAIEVYKNRFIAFSLGNFCTYSRMSLSPPNNLAPIAEVFVNPSGEFYYCNIHSCIQIKNKGVFLDTQFSALKKIRELTNADLPENKLVFKNNVRVVKK